MSVCKICLCSDPENYLSQITSSGNIDQSGEYVVLFCLGIQVVHGSESSVRLCERCYTKLTEFYQFKSQALRNEAALSSLGLEKYIERDIKSEVLSQASDDNSYDEPLIPYSQLQRYEELQDEKPVELLDTKCSSSTVVVLENKPVIKEQDVKVLVPDKVPTVRKEVTSGVNNLKTTKKSTKRDLFPCATCGKQFKSKYAFMTHLNTHKSTKTYQCSHCPEIFSEKKLLGMHLDTHRTSKWLYECAHCGKTYFSKSPLAKHIMCYHPEEVSLKASEKRTVCCQMCPTKFYTKLALIRHLKTVHGNDVRCPICNKQTTALYLEQHIKTVHEPEALVYKCDQCDRRFCRPSGLKKHVTVHSNVKPFPCDICGAKFRLKYSVALHKAEVHEKIKNHICHICSKGFFSASVLRSHIRKHAEIRRDKDGKVIDEDLRPKVRVPCPDCGKPIVADPKGMQRHRSLHKGQQHACKLCGLTFATRRYVACHMKTHFQEKKYACRFCGTKFVRCSAKCRHEREVHIAAGEKKPPRKDTRRNRVRKKKKKVEEDSVPSLPVVTLAGPSQEPAWTGFPLSDPFKSEIDVMNSE